MNKRFMIICFLLLISSINLFCVGPFSGTYITPKLNYKNEVLNKTNNIELGKLPDLDKNNYVGAGFALGYDFFRVTRLVPLRIDFEYMFDWNLSKNNSFMQSFLGNIYYDINIFFLRNEELDVVTSRSLFERNPNMTLYIGFSFGSRLYQIIDNEFLINRSSIMYGINTGITYNINDWLAIDIGYRYLRGFGFRESHEVLFGTRFTLL